MRSEKTRSLQPHSFLGGAYSRPSGASLATQTQASWPRRILVGTDGSSASDAAVATARELAARSGASVELVVVHVPQMAVPEVPHRVGFDRCEAPERSLAARLLQNVRRQLHAGLREPRSWPLRLEVGEPVAVLARVAEESAADLVVVGIGRQEPADRRQGGRTSVFATRQLSVPVYAAARGCEAPTRALLVLPDGRAHAPTILRAAACVQPHGKLWMVLPESVPADAAHEVEAGSAYGIAMRACGPDIEPYLGSLDCQRLDIAGDMLTGVLQLAEEVQAELIAVPVRGMPGPIRTFLPNIAEPLLLTARCSVLVAPDEGSQVRPQQSTND